MSPYSFQFRVYSICKTKTHHLSPYKKVNLGGVLVVLLTLENKVNTKLGLEFDNNLHHTGIQHFSQIRVTTIFKCFLTIYLTFVYTTLLFQLWLSSINKRTERSE